MNVLITGGAGFIGSHVVKHFIADCRYHVYNLDKLTYAGNPNNLTGVDFKDTYDNSHKEIRNTHINIGTGKEISIKELAETIKEIVGF